MAFNLQHQTAAEFGITFWRKCREAFEAGDKLKYHRMIWWLWQKIQDGDITSAQARTAYNAAFNKSLTLAQWNTLVTNRFIPIKDRYLAWQAESLV